MSEVGLGAELAGVDVGAFQVHAEHPGTALGAVFGVDPELGQDLADFRAGGGHGGGQQRGGAETQMGAGDGFEGRATLHDVLAATAVDVQVDKARQQVGQVIVRRVAGAAFDGDDLAVLMDQAATDPALGREDIVFGHGRFSGSRGRIQRRSSATKS